MSCTTAGLEDVPFGFGALSLLVILALSNNKLVDLPIDLARYVSQFNLNYAGSPNACISKMDNLDSMALTLCLSLHIPCHPQPSAPEPPNPTP